MNSTDLIEKILREYRQMVPVKTLFTNPKTLQDGTPWTCLDCQEQIFKKVNNDISSINKMLADSRGPALQFISSLENIHYSLSTFIY